MSAESQLLNMAADQLVKAAIEPQWFDDHDELIAFARWYWEGPNFSVTSQTAEILDFFEKPWKWTPEYEAWKAGEE